MYAFGYYSVVEDEAGKRFDSSADLNYHNNIHDIVTSLCQHADQQYTANVERLRRPEQSQEDYKQLVENAANLWSSFKATLQRNKQMPYQQIVAPDGHIYWWIKLV